MYCKMLGIGNGAILKKINVCKSLVELYSAILVRFSIFSLQLELIVATLSAAAAGALLYGRIYCDVL